MPCAHFLSKNQGVTTFAPQNDCHVMLTSLRCWYTPGNTLRSKHSAPRAQQGAHFLPRDQGGGGWGGGYLSLTPMIIHPF